MHTLSDQKQYTIPVFIPQLACPHQCVFCNQRKISGTMKSPSMEEVQNIIDNHLRTFPDKEKHVEIGFFGGSFTGIPFDRQESYLQIADSYFKKGEVQGIRLSTRPDYIDLKVLLLLKAHHVTTIELGAQSLDEEVLRLSGRGHTVKDVEKASAMIKNEGFELGLQMMIGLPGDTVEKSVATAQRIVELGAGNTRIYPTLVIRETDLEKLYLENKYIPLTLSQAVDNVKRLIPVFESGNVQIIRIGLHPSEGLLNGNDMLAGPFHVSFRELVMTEIWNDIQQQLIINAGKGKNIVIHVSPAELNVAIGYGGKNRKMLQKHYRNVKYTPDSSLNARNYYVDYC